MLLMSMANAQMIILEPQNRLSAGVSWSDGSLGVATSFDSRLSQIIYVNVGLFRSFQDSELSPIDDDPQTWLAMRHGLWAAPGFRIPHRYRKKGINWDITLRGGFGAIFMDLAERKDAAIIEFAGLYGADLLLKGKRKGFRSTIKMFNAQPYIYEFREKVWMHRIQSTAEFFYQW